MSPEEQLVSGKNFLQIEEFVKYKWGKDGLRDYMKNRLFEMTMIQEFRLYPFNEYVKCIQTVDKLFESENLAYDIGEFRGRHMISPKLKTPRSRFNYLSNIERAWRNFNNFGKVEVVLHSPDKISINISNYKSHPLYCVRTSGFFHGFVAGKQKDVCTVEEVQCINKGEEVCEFLIELHE